VIAHVGGVPVEELISTAAGAGTALLLARAWVVSRVRRGRRRSAGVRASRGVDDPWIGPRRSSTTPTAGSRSTSASTSRTHGRRGHRLSGWKARTLLLVTRGRRSGKLRRTALAYGEHDGRCVIVASNGGAKRHPDWYLNLLEDPAVQVQVRDDRFAARARDASADERPALWKLMTSLSPTLDDYQRNSGREIPVVILERIWFRHVWARSGLT